MGQPLLAGVALTMAAGLMSGTCMLPVKFVRSWKWENLWLVFSLVSLVIIPWMLAIGLVGSLFETYRTLPFRQLAIPMLFGTGWEVAQILFGVSVKRLGLGVAYAIIVGLGAVLGTLVPLFAQQRPTAKEHAIQLIVGGVAVMVIGISLTTWGGQIKERATDISQSASHRAYPAAIFLAVLCGSWPLCSTTRSPSGKASHRQPSALEIGPCTAPMQFGQSDWREGFFLTLLTACGCFSRIGLGLCSSVVREQTSCGLA